MDDVVILVVIVLICTLAVYCGLWKRYSNISGLVILFIDAPDPDNPAAALAIIKSVLHSKFDFEILHVVLTGRPVNFRTAKVHESSTTGRQVIRQSWETSVPSHAHLLLQDSAARISKYLEHCDAFNRVLIYDGGIAPNAPLSDTTHDWDFLFDRRDLVTGNVSDQGEILYPSEYLSLIKKYNLLSPNERENEIVSILRAYKLAPLETLKRKIVESKEVHVFLGGPATAVVNAFEGIRDCKKIKTFIGMFGASEPGKATLLNNQFNIACDMESAKQLLASSFLPQVTKYFITTECAKQSSFIVSASELEVTGINSYIVKLQRLWEFTHNNKEQPLFDVLTVMAFLPKYKSYFKWSKKKAYVDDDEVLQFVDSEDGKNLHFVSKNIFPEMTKQLFLEFLKHIYGII